MNSIEPPSVADWTPRQSPKRIGPKVALSRFAELAEMNDPGQLRFFEAFLKESEDRPDGWAAKKRFELLVQPHLEAEVGHQATTDNEITVVYVTAAPALQEAPAEADAQD